MSTPTPSASPRYIWQHSAGPRLAFDAAALAPALDQARLEQGRLLGLLGAIGLVQVMQDALANHGTATRDLTHLLAKGLLRAEGAGRATRYAVTVPGCEQPVVRLSSRSRGDHHFNLAQIKLKT